MPIPKVIGRLNRWIANPIVGLIAGRIPPFAIVEHRGRVSGRSYRTPLMAFPAADGLVIALTYGATTDWVRNVLAAGGARVARAGRTPSYDSPRIVPGEAGMRLLPAVIRVALRLMHVDEFLLLSRAAR